MCITGPSGCGKTECIRTLGAAHREMGHLVKTDIVCTEAVESEELLGYVDPETRCVTEGGGGEREGGMDDCDSETPLNVVGLSFHNVFDARRSTQLRRKLGEVPLYS